MVERDDSLGTTNGVKFSVLQKVFFTFWVRSGSRPLDHSQVYRALYKAFAKGQHGRGVLEQLRSNENLKIMHIHLRFFIRLDLAIGCHHWNRRFWFS